MKKAFKKWTFRLIVTGLFLFGLLVLFMLNPIILYAHKTVLGNYAIFHNEPLNKTFQSRLEQSNAIIKSCELYDSNLKIDICVNDGSKYPKLIETILGKDLLSSFYNKIVFCSGKINYENNYVELDKHKWNLTQMLAHVETHCLEFNKYGLWQSNPIGRHPNWKWEGYPEYISRQDYEKQNLQKDIETLLRIEQISNDGWMMLPDSTETLITYYEYKLLIKFCMEIKKMNFVQILKDTSQEETIRQQMITWFKEPHH